MRALRPGLRALSALAPGLAAGLAARLLLTPPRHPARAPETARLASGRPTVLVVDGAPVQAWSWGRGPAVLLVHGWGGRAGQLGALVPPLLARGLAVVAFDAPGHGASAGRQSSVPAFVAAIRAVDRALGPVRGLIAHSIGAVAATRAVHEGLPLEAAVFLAPPADLAGVSVHVAAELGFSRRVRDLMRAGVERRVGMPWSALDVVALAPGLEVPLLVLHDREDGEIPWQSGALVARAWPGARLVTTQGLGHRRILADPGAIAEAVGFVAGRIRPRARDAGVGEPASYRLPARNARAWASSGLGSPWPATSTSRVK